MNTKPRTRRAISILAALGLISLVIAPASGFDSTPPNLESATFSQSQISESGGSVLVTLKITSNTGLLNLPVIVISLPSNAGRQLAFGSVALASGDSKSGIYSQQFQIPANQMPGSYQLVVYPLTDTSQNATSFIYTKTYLAYGNVTTPTPTPTPTPTFTVSPSESPISKPTSNPIDLLSISNLNSSIVHLNTTVEHLRACLSSAKKIISSKKGKLPINC